MMGNALNNVQDAPKAAPKADGVTCSNCKATVPATSKFCPECFNKMPTDKFCPECGNKVSSTSKFCPECGKQLN